jgi:ABC-type transport system substrate-binding protein
MKRDLRVLAAAGSLLLALTVGQAALAQKAGGVLKIGWFDSPASMSLHEESTVAVNRPMMGVFNNLVMYKQDVPQNSMKSIIPDLAASWAWNEEGTELSFPLRQGVKWHDGKPFTANDVKCTWDLLSGRTSDKLRLNPRKSWYKNLEEVTTNGDYEVTFHLRRPQPSLLALLASGLVGGPSLPRLAARHAHTPDRHRPVQVRRIQAERSDSSDQKPGLLEREPALSRRHRISDHARRVDAHARLHRREDRRVWADDPATEGCQEPGSPRDL